VRELWLLIARMMCLRDRGRQKVRRLLSDV
jgi:hypothetical protein